MPCQVPGIHYRPQTDTQGEPGCAVGVDECRAPPWKGLVTVPEQTLELFKLLACVTGWMSCYVLFEKKKVLCPVIPRPLSLFCPLLILSLSFLFVLHSFFSPSFFLLSKRPHFLPEKEKSKIHLQHAFFLWNKMTIWSALSSLPPFFFFSFPLSVSFFFSFRDSRSSYLIPHAPAEVQWSINDPVNKPPPRPMFQVSCWRSKGPWGADGTPQ